MNLAARLEHRPLLHTLVKTGKREVPWPVALRNTAAIVLPLAIGAWTNHLGAGLGISVGALNCMFADQPGPYGLRFRRMLLTSVIAGLAAFAGLVLGEWPLALVLVAAPWGFASALLVAIDAYATSAGLVSLLLLVIMSAEPQMPALAAPVALLIFAGGLLQMLFAVAAWPLQRYRPERLALTKAFRGLAGFARTDVVPGSTIALPPSLNDLQSMLFGAGRARGRAVEAFRVLAELAERIRIELFALAQQQSQCESPATCDALAAVRNAAAGVLDTLATALQQAAPPKSEAALDAWSQANAGESATDPTQANLLVSHIAALGGQLRAAVRNADTAGSRGEIRARRAELQLPRALRPANPLATLRANLRLSSSACRHAVRCGVCVAVALAISHVLPLSRGYWLPMTVVIVLRPDFGATWRFGLLRVIGTLAGLLLTTAFLHFVGLGNFWIALALLTVLCFAYRELAIVHYGIAVICITGLVVILLSFYGIPPESVLGARAIDTVLGSALALLAYFAWPTWERGRERKVLASLLDTYANYLDAVLRGDTQARDTTRVDARAARSAAQASLDRLRAEPASRVNLPRAEALVAQANRVVRAAMLLEAARDDGDAWHDPSLDPFAQACNDALREGARALREARPPQPAPDLRAAQQRLAASVATSDDTLACTMRDTSDSIVDAIDSVLHVLAQPNASGT